MHLIFLESCLQAFLQNEILYLIINGEELQELLNTAGTECFCFSTY